MTQAARGQRVEKRLQGAAGERMGSGQCFEGLGCTKWMGCSGWREHNKGAERAWQVTELRVWGAGRSGRGRGRRCGLGPGPGGLELR